MHAATLLLIVLAAGLASQWVAWQIGLPGIVVLIASGLVLEPVTGVIQLGAARRADRADRPGLKWEGIVNDPVGVLLAVLTFQYLTIGGGLDETRSPRPRCWAAWAAGPPAGCTAAAWCPSI